MTHRIFYLGRLDENHDRILQYGRVSGFKRQHEGVESATGPSGKDVTGLTFGFMEQKANKKAGQKYALFAVSVKELVLPNPVELDINRHMDGKSVAPNATQFGDGSARALLEDMEKAHLGHPETLAKLRTLRKEAGLGEAAILDITWDKPPWADILSIAELRKEKIISHEVIGPKKEESAAKCIVQIDGNRVYLDYSNEKVKGFNEENEMDIGVARLTFTDDNWTCLQSVGWRGEGRPDFEEHDIKTSFPRIVQGTVEAVEKRQAAVRKQAARLSDEELRKKLPSPGHKPARVMVTTTVFERDPYVVEAVLRRANGTCERCKKEAPFRRAKDDSFYLEVHHMLPLASDGDDTEENAIALCPNCHRELHFGKV